MATSPELIAERSFDDKFKNTLRDYYVYGFKRKPDGSKSVQTALNNWNRLNNILKREEPDSTRKRDELSSSPADYITWSDERGKPKFITLDSQSVACNPFHRVYRFCTFTPDDPVMFLHTMAALSEQIVPYHGYEDLTKDKESRVKEWQESPKQSDNKNHPLLEVYGDDDYPVQPAHVGEKEIRGRELKSSQLSFVYPQTIRSDEKTINNRLSEMECLGILHDRQEQGKKRGAGHHRWSLPEPTLADVIRAGEEANGEFEKHLSSALKFYSGYFAFGEIGMYLLDRLGDGQTNSPFRFSHSYFIHALNDINRIDLLYAIEHKKWCSIECTHATEGWRSETLCYPLEIRASSVSGRECLMYYDPVCRSYSAVRLEFIDTIRYYGDDAVKHILLEEGVLKKDRQIESDLENARDALRHTWGTATPDADRGNAISRVKLSDVEVRLTFHPRKEMFLVHRLLRERRFGEVSLLVCRDGITREYPLKKENAEQVIREHARQAEPGDILSESDVSLRFHVAVTDPQELRPWLRSYYSRIVSCLGMDEKGFSVKSDTEKWLTAPEAASGFWSQDGSRAIIDSCSPNINKEAPEYSLENETKEVPGNFPGNEMKEVPEDFPGNETKEAPEEFPGNEREKASEDAAENPGENESKKRKLAEYNRILNRVLDKLKTREEDVVEHRKLFHETFGVYYYMLSEIFTAFSSISLNDETMESVIKQVTEGTLLHKYSSRAGRETEYILRDLRKTIYFKKKGKNITYSPCGFFAADEEGAGFHPMYRFTKGKRNTEKKEEKNTEKRAGQNKEKNFYRDIVPLSEVEVRWLKTILEDEKAGIFFDGAELLAVKKVLDSEICGPSGDRTKFPMIHMNQFDQYDFSNDLKAKEQAVLRKLIAAIDEHRAVKVKYRTVSGRRIRGKFRPIIIEFSKRNNRFQGYFMPCDTKNGFGDAEIRFSDTGNRLTAKKKKTVFIFNISQLETLDVTEEPFDYKAALDTLSEYRKSIKCDVTVKFSDKKNLADRILTAFAYLEKECVYDEASREYRLKLFYQKTDQKDIVLRLMGYGADIRFADKDDPIAVIVREKVKRQQNVCETREPDRVFSPDIVPEPETVRWNEDLF